MKSIAAMIFGHYFLQRRIHLSDERREVTVGETESHDGIHLLFALRDRCVRMRQLPLQNLLLATEKRIARFNLKQHHSLN